MMAAKKQNNGSDRHLVELDEVAFQRLEELQRDDESLSDVIKRCIPARTDATEILRIMRKARLSPATLAAIDRSARQRRATSHRTKE